jgi:uncharacterized phage-associated protein
MFVNTHRQKLINAIVFFAENTRRCGKIKLFKLLYLMDFEHFRQTGISVTGLQYQAWKFGPVPIEVMEEWEDLELDLATAIDIVPERVIDYTRETIVPRVAFNNQNFTRRELQIMQRLAETYRDTFSPIMIDVTHAENGAWATVWNNGIGDHNPIPYDLAIADDNHNREVILEMARQYAGLTTEPEYDAHQP